MDTQVKQAASSMVLNTHKGHKTIWIVESLQKLLIEPVITLDTTSRLFALKSTNSIQLEASSLKN